MVEATDEVTNLIKTVLTSEQIEKLEKIYYFDQFCDDFRLAEDAKSLTKEVESYFIQANINKSEIQQICNDIFEKYQEIANKSESNDEETQIYEEESDEEQTDGQCELCLKHGRITLHHAIPKLIIKRMMKKKKVKRADLVKYIKLCRHCHSQVHKTIPHAQLAKNYHTIDALLNADDMQEYIKKVRKQSK